MKFGEEICSVNGDDDSAEGNSDEEEEGEEKEEKELEENGVEDDMEDPDKETNGAEVINGESEVHEEDYTNIELYQRNNSPPMQYSPDMVSSEEVKAILEKEIPLPTEFHPVFTKFLFSPRQVAEENIPIAILSMMKDLDMIRRWCIHRDALAKFILMTRNGYRDNPYHNWRHAFSVTHFAYLLLKNLELVKVGALEHLEALAFFISAICHDVDHRGTSNAYHKKSHSVLAALYTTDSSTLENHHISQAIAILQTEGCNILANLTKSEYDEFIETLKSVILATDIVNHFGILHDLQDMSEDDSYNPKDPQHHDLVLSLLMTSCDLSDQTKEWKSAIAAASTVYEEFLAQGDLEKKMGLVPMDMMNRDIAVVTDLQVSFVDKIAIPVYSMLSRVFPKSYDALRGILINRKKWIRLQILYSNTTDDPDIEKIDPCDLMAIINALQFEGATIIEY